MTMATATTVGAVSNFTFGDASDLQLPADDVDVIAGALPEHGPQGVTCGGGYCPSEYCQSAYSSK